MQPERDKQRLWRCLGFLTPRERHLELRTLPWPTAGWETLKMECFFSKGNQSCSAENRHFPKPREPGL